MPLTFEGLNTFPDPESRRIIYSEIVNAYGSRTSTVTCEIGKGSEPDSITITFPGIPHAGLCLVSGEYWRKRGVIEEKVRQALANAEDPKWVERSLLGKSNV